MPHAISSAGGAREHVRKSSTKQTKVASVDCASRFAVALCAQWPRKKIADGRADAHSRSVARAVRAVAQDPCGGGPRDGLSVQPSAGNEEGPGVEPGAFVVLCARGDLNPHALYGH